MQRTALLSDLTDFIESHDPRTAPLTADATEPAWNGYRLTVACSCGVMFGWSVTPEEADADRLRLASLNRHGRPRFLAE
jgi:hypothetical protein